MRQIVSDSLLTLLFIVAQTTLARFLAVGGLPPDIALVWIVYLGIARGQIAGCTAGFFTGLAFDLLSGNDGMLGLAALAKTVGGFVAGYFYSEKRTAQTLSTYRFLLVLGLTASVHNLIYFIIFLQGSSVSWWRSILFFGVPAALYTTAVGLIPMFAFARRAQS